jgi:hypothetical protein
MKPTDTQILANVKRLAEYHRDSSSHECDLRGYAPEYIQHMSKGSEHTARQVLDLIETGREPNLPPGEFKCQFCALPDVIKESVRTAND